MVTITPEYSSLQESLVAWPPGMLTAVENTIPCGINYMYVTMDTILHTALLPEINQRVTERLSDIFPLTVEMSDRNFRLLIGKPP